VRRGAHGVPGHAGIWPDVRQERAQMDLHAERWGERGETVLLVHGSVTNGEATWLEQRPLADSYRLIVLDRRGYYPNSEVEREDFEVDAVDVADLLASGGAAGMHLVGHSYGGVISLLAAARRPSSVRSLTVIEPPALDVAADDPVVQSFARGIDEYWSHWPRDPEAFLRGFLERAGSAIKPPSPLPRPLQQAARLLMVQRSPAEARIPLGELRRAAFPKLVVSGGHSPVFERICDVLAAAMDAERGTVTGAGHSVPRTGAPFNQRLTAFIEKAEAQTLRAAG
jgi:pimeloyl-ACP methyl ester carboxylesterase